MNIDFDNPKWTAYVLGELSPQERAAVELELAASPDGQAFVQELQLAASTMKDELARQPLPGLSFEQRKTVREAAGAAPARQVPILPAAGLLARFPWWAAAGAAAAILVVGVVLWQFRPMEPVQIAGIEMRQEPAAPNAGPIPPENSGPTTAAPPVNTSKTAVDAAKKGGAVQGGVQESANREARSRVQGASTPAGETQAIVADDKRDKNAAEQGAVQELKREATRYAPLPAPAPSVPSRPMAVAPPRAPSPTPDPGPPLFAQAESVAPPIAPAQVFPQARATQGQAAASGPASGGGRGGGIGTAARGQGQGANANSGNVLNNAINQGAAQTARGGGGGGGRGGRGAGGGAGPGAGGGAPGFGANGGFGGGNAGGTFGGTLGTPVGGAAGGGLLTNSDNFSQSFLESLTDATAMTGSTNARSSLPGLVVPRLDGNGPYSLPNATGAGTGRGNYFNFSDNLLPFGVDVKQMTAAGEPPPLPPLPPLLGRAVPVDVYGLRLDNRSNTETYTDVTDNPFFTIGQEPPTFAIDVDTASYSNVRRFLNGGQLPPHAAVRIEELVNYFSYDYPRAVTDHPITANIEAAAAPWNSQHRLVRIGIKAKDVQVGEKPSNLVFLIDVSGSMEPADRLPLLKSGLRLLVQRLTENDRVTIVTYAGESGVALPPTNGTRKDAILAAIDALRAEGSTNGGAGIQTAYDMAAANFIRGGVNRVVLMTDGDFNVGITNQNDLVRLIEEKARTGVFLSVLGVGTGNVKDSTMERLADRGNGLYAYIDSLNEARKVLVDQMAGTLIAVAKDVKVQVEFNPAQVAAYRLIGYENRALTAADFANDKKDAGDMSAGHAVTALFEVVPVGAAASTATAAGPLRYQPGNPAAPAPAATVNVPAAVAKEMLDLKIRYKDPEGTESKLIEFPLVDRGQTFESASSDFRFAASVAEFGMLLRSSPYRGAAAWESVISIANGSRGTDKEGYREEFIRLAQRAEQLWRSGAR